MDSWVPGFITGSLALLGVVIAGVLQSRRERAQHHDSSTTPGAPSVQEIWQRQDRIEIAFRASLVLLGEIAEQWDGPHPPKLSSRAIKTLQEGNYLPPEFDNLLQNGEHIT